MKKSAGNLIVALAVVTLCLMATPATARLTASVDRADVAIGETLRLTLSADAGERPDEVDLSTLERDFEVLNRSSATSARLVNGQQSISRTLELELAPRRVGLVTIPSLTAGGRSTTPIAVKVSPASDIEAGDAVVLFSADLDREDVYVQAQLLLTLTLQQAISLDQREVTPLQLPDADVEMLEQRTFQRQIDGRLWQVIELRYAIFPQQSGTLEIPPLSFSGREILPGRSLLGARLGRRIQIETDPITVPVKPVPKNFPGSTWLPARSLAIEESWSKEPSQLALGDSSTRSLNIRADGLQGSQLPPLDSLDGQASLAGLRFYPGQESIDQIETDAGLTGLRRQSDALVPSQPGDWTLPAQRLPWWNTETDTLEYASIPARTITVMPAVAQAGQLPTPTSETATGIPTRSLPLWFVGFTAAGWGLAALLGLLMWRQRRTATISDSSDTQQSDSQRRALVALRLACQNNNPAAARDGLLRWGRIRQGTETTLDELRAFASPALAAAIDELQRALYSRAEGNWQGQALFTAVREEPAHRVEQGPQVLTLYPTTREV